MSHSIQIYNGQGANNVSVQAWKRELNESVDGRLYKIEEFNSSYTAGFDRGNVALVILPNGTSSAMFDPLLHLAEKIKQAIADKASFLGSGAGAFLTASPCQDIFDFNPIPMDSCSMPYLKNRDALEVEWMPSSGHFQTDTCVLSHASGPTFSFEQIYPKDRFHCRILAQYKADGTSNKAHSSAAAILYQPCKSTPRLLTGVYPEIDVLSNESERLHIDALDENMKNNEVLRKGMCRSWFSELGIKVRI